MAKIQRYGKTFDTSLEDDDGNQIWDDLGIEMWCIKQSDEWRASQGTSLIDHYESCRKIIWPELDSHRWEQICRDTILTHKITVLMGCASSGKTHSPAWVYLVEYWCFPNQTCVLVSSTHIPGLRKRIWAEMTMLWSQGVERFPKLSGHLLDSAIAITTDNLEDCEPGQRKIRDMRKGIFGVACVSGGKFVGLGRFIGIKQKRMRLIADEAQAMGDSFLSAFSNLNQNEDFRATILGNPNDIMDPLGRAAEPKDGWSERYLEPDKTTTWETRFMNGRCVNLVGLDSPNFDYPADQPTKFKYLISKEKIADTLSFFPKDSIEYYAMCLGVMKIGTISRRVLSREMCVKYGALEDVIWKGGNKTKIYFVDSSYGGDRCVGGYAEFGEDVNGKIVLAFNRPKIIPIIVGRGEPEDQIARFVVEDCKELKIEDSNMGHDSTGRGGLGTALSREFKSANSHPIDSGGRPTKRPVSLEIKVLDEKTNQMRLKRCDEEYDRLVTEFWFQVRMAVEAGQVRQLPEDVMEELCGRKWDKVKGDKKSVEVKDGTPQKPGYKQRLGRSCDLGDWAAGIVEMARRKGFQISKLPVEAKTKIDLSSYWADKKAKALLANQLSKQLQQA